MKRRKKGLAKRIVFTALALHLIVGAQVYFGTNNKAVASEETHCRLNVYRMNGQICYDCYWFDEGPYWGCIGCPWSTC